MSHNPIISEILRGQWLLDTSNIEAYYQIADALLQGKKLDFISKYKDSETKGLGILNADGKPIYAKSGETVSIPQNSIAQVNMIGEVVEYSDFCVVGADEIVDQLYSAQSFQNVDATIFNINTPGGSVKAIEPFREFAKYKTKPVIGLVRDALSLGYWAACEICDEIYSYGNVSARFGSVGVVASFRDSQPVMEKLGYKFHEIYADESTHKNLAFTKAIAGDYAMIKAEHLSPLAIKFQEAVRAARPNLKEEVGVLTGKTFFADEALRLGMIDGIGDTKIALSAARRLANQYKVKSLI